MTLTWAALLVVISGLTRLLVVCSGPHEGSRIELAHAKGHCLCEHEDAPGPEEGTDLDHPHGDCTDLPLPDHLAPAASHQGPASDQVDDPPDAPTVALLPARPKDRAPPSWLVYATGPPRPDSLLRLRRSVVLLL